MNYNIDYMLVWDEPKFEFAHDNQGDDYNNDGVINILGYTAPNNWNAGINPKLEEQSFASENQ